MLEELKDFDTWKELTLCIVNMCPESRIQGKASASMSSNETKSLQQAAASGLKVKPFINQLYFIELQLQHCRRLICGALAVTA